MEYRKRYLWYKTISFEEKEEAMKIVKIEMRSKLRVLWTPERRLERSMDMIGENNPAKRPEVRDKISASKTGEKNPMYGKTFNHTKESKDKMSISKMGENNVMYGKVRPLHSERMRGKNNPMYGKTGENNPNYIDGRSFDPQYHRRYYLKSLGLPDEFIELALLEKKKRTDIELMMEHWLINNEISYKFQKYINLPSTYTKVDFFIEPNICLYCDGNRFHESEEAMIRDKRITKELEELEYRVIRVWGSDIREGIRPWEIFGLS